MHGWRSIALLGGWLVLTAGCASGPHATAGTALGTGLGAMTGAVIGSQTGHAGGGALLGAATGALAGGLIGNAEDARYERDAAVAQLHYERAAQQAQGLTNADLVMLSQSGVGDEVIINAVNTRGGRFDLSPAALIQLKNSGISDRVLLAIQSTRAAASPYGAPPPVPEVVVVPPPPAIELGFMVGPRPYPHRHRHGW